jgi:hypothetical protein
MTKEGLMDVLLIFIVVVAINAAFYSGFYFGYMKREDKPPEKLIPNIKEVINTIKPEKKEKLSREQERELNKANDFYN